MNKKELRATLRDRLNQIPDPQGQEKSRAACDLLFHTPEFESARVVMMFLSLPRELDTATLIQKSLPHKTIVVPKINWDKWLLIPVELKNLDEPMEFHRYNLHWPAGREDFPLDKIDLIVIPGLGFDERGCRIGRGGGFYDRFLAHPELHALNCGIAFEEQVVPHVPIAAHDKCLDMLVTDAQIRHFDRANIKLTKDIIY